MVIKVPSREGQGYIRAVYQQNARWYRDFCGEYVMRRVGRMKRRSRYRKPRTIIKRCHTRTALLHLMAGKNSTLYSKRLVDFIERAGEETHRPRDLFPEKTRGET